jgi:hypothetical protein
MNWFWMNVPLMVVFFAAITGIPLWLSLRHPDTGPAALAESVLDEDLAIDAELLVVEAEMLDASRLPRTD